MATTTHTSPKRHSDATPDGDPDVLVCETCPGRSVFVESGNAHGWISTDLTVELNR
jgi:hypothetical protein